MEIRAKKKTIQCEKWFYLAANQFPIHEQFQLMLLSHWTDLTLQIPMHHGGYPTSQYNLIQMDKGKIKVNLLIYIKVRMQRFLSSSNHLPDQSQL